MSIILVLVADVIACTRKKIYSIQLAVSVYVRHGRKYRCIPVLIYKKCLVWYNHNYTPNLVS